MSKKFPWHARTERSEGHGEFFEHESVTQYRKMGGDDDMRTGIKKNRLKKVFFIFCITLGLATCIGTWNAFSSFKSISSSIILTLEDLVVYSFNDDSIVSPAEYAVQLQHYMYKNHFYFEDTPYPGEVIIAAYALEKPIYVYSTEKNYSIPGANMYLPQEVVDRFPVPHDTTEYTMTIRRAIDSKLYLFGYSLVAPDDTKLAIMCRISFKEFFSTLFLHSFSIAFVFIFALLLLLDTILRRNDYYVSEKYLRLLDALDNAGVPICIADCANHEVAFHNKAMELYCANKAMRKKTNTIFPRPKGDKPARISCEKKFPCVDCSTKRFLTEQEGVIENQIQYTWQSPETGNTYAMSESFSKFATHTFKTTMIHDMTAQTESKLETKRQTSILDSLVDILISFDLNKKIQYVNQSGYTIIGFKEGFFVHLEQLAAEKIIDPKINFGKLTDYADMVIHNREPQMVKASLKTYAGITIPVDVTMFPTYDDGNTLLGFAMILHNTSDVEYVNQKISKYAKQQQFVAYLSVLMMSVDDFDTRIKSLITKMAQYFDSKEVHFKVQASNRLSFYEIKHHLVKQEERYEFDDHHLALAPHDLFDIFQTNEYIITEEYDGLDERLSFFKDNDPTAAYLHVGLKIVYNSALCGYLFFDTPKHSSLLHDDDEYDTEFILTLQNIIVMAVEGYVLNNISNLYSIYMHAIFSANKDLVLLLDPDGNILDTNEAAYYKKESIGLNILDILDNLPDDEKGPIDSDMVREQFEQIKSTGKAAHYQNSTRKDIIFDTEYYPIVGEDKITCAILCISRNITEKINLQRELDMQRQRINFMLSSLPISFFVFDKDLNLINLISDELTPDDWQNLMDNAPNQVQSIKNTFNDVPSTFLTNRQNRYFTTYTYPYREDGEIKYGLGIVFDTTDSYLSEFAAKKTASRFEMTVNAINIGFVEYNLTKNRFAYDDTTKLLCDIQQADTRDLDNLDNVILHRLIGNKNVNEIKNNCVVDKDNKCFVNNGIVLKDGTERQLLTWFYYVKEKDLHGESEPKLIGITSDYTNQYEQDKKIIVEKEKVESELAIKSEFLSRIGYEIRTPMNAIIGMIKIAKRSKDILKIQSCFEKIEISTMHLLSIINDVLDISNINTGKLTVSNEEFDFENFVMETVSIASMQTEEKRQEITVKISPGIPKELYGDKMRLNQVILNLMSNAIKFTPDDGKIGLTIDVESTEFDAIALKFSISDTGIGMSDAQIDKIFGTTYQLSNHFDNNGLGLVITRNIIDALNGRIWAESKLEQGTKVSFVIPLKIVNEKHSIELPSDLREEDVKVLILDADSEAREEMKLILDSCKFNHDITSDSTLAINMAKFASDENDPYNVIFVDWEMSDMEGIEIITKMIKNSVDSAIIVMTSMYDYEEVKKQAFRLGINKVLSKPLYPSIIVNSIIYSVKKTTLMTEIDYPGEYNFDGFNILVVDDIDINVEIIKELLAPTNITMDVAYSGVQVVELYKSNPLRYSLILMDIQMFDMDGYTATKEIRNSGLPRCKNIPIIALTANFRLEDVEMEESAGMNGHIDKPISETELLQTIKKHLSKDISKPTSVSISEGPSANLTKLSLPGIDVSTGLSHVDNKTNLYIRLLRSFKDSNHLIDIKAYVSEGNQKEALSEAYSIKGVAGNLGLYNLTNAAGSIYDVIKSGVMEIHGPEFLYFEKVYDETIRSIDVILKRDKL